MLLLVAVVAAVPSVSAIGVMPAGKLLDYVPGKTMSFDLTVLNNDHHSMRVFLSTESNLSRYLSIDRQELDFTPTEDKKIFRVTFTIPGDLEPGTQVFNIFVSEMPSQRGIEEGSTIAATATVISQIRINVPYPGLYAKAVLNAPSPKPNDPAIFSISVYNMGTQDITTAVADIDIFGPTNDRLGTFTTDTKAIKAGTEEKLSGAWGGTKNPGKYFARGVVTYDSKKIVVEQVFEVGEKNVEIRNFRSEGFRLGGIVKIFMDLKNTWNQDIAEAFADIDVVDANGNVVGNFKTITIPIGALEMKTLDSFWDTKGLETGKYELHIKLHYDGKTTEQVESVFIDLNELRFGDNAVSGLVVANQPSAGAGQYTIVIIVVIVLVILNVVLFMYVRRNKGNQQPPPQQKQ